MDHFGTVFDHLCIQSVTTCVFFLIRDVAAFSISSKLNGVVIFLGVMFGISSCESFWNIFLKKFVMMLICSFSFTASPFSPCTITYFFGSVILISLLALYILMESSLLFSISSASFTIFLFSLFSSISWISFNFLFLSFDSSCIFILLLLAFISSRNFFCSSDSLYTFSSSLFFVLSFFPVLFLLF